MNKPLSTTMPNSEPEMIKWKGGKSDRVNFSLAPPTMMTESVRLSLLLSVVKMLVLEVLLVRGVVCCEKVGEMKVTMRMRRVKRRMERRRRGDDEDDRHFR